MIEVTVDSVRVSMVSQHRVVVLREVGEERYLPIWIGPYEADAIAIGLQGVEIARPLTHDLLKAVVEETGATISHVLVNDLRDDTFYARIILDVNGRHAEVDSRPSDAIALAVRAKVPILVAESVMDRAGIVPSPGEEEELSPEDEEKLAVFREFIDSLNLDDLGDEEDEDEA
ncbi:MAG TPA: bifunctional nuclease family protein [Anaerolineae bacterium]|nr:bifunctional nuclease family protein [Anaerolineae bacterium]